MTPLKHALHVWGLTQPTALEKAAIEFAAAQRSLLDAEAALEQAQAERGMYKSRVSRLAATILELGKPSHEPS